MEDKQKKVRRHTVKNIAELSECELPIRNYF